MEFELQLYEAAETPNYRFLVSGDARVQVRRGERAGATSATAFFYENPPVIWFSDGSSLEGNQYVELKHEYSPFDAARIQTWKWGVDIRKESQGKQKDLPTRFRPGSSESCEPGTTP